jgi:hypothetical protein
VILGLLQALQFQIMATLTTFIKRIFGRDASPGELASYAGIFGPTIEPNEIKDFILGGVTSKEITQDEPS